MGIVFQCQIVLCQSLIKTKKQFFWSDSSLEKGEYWSRTQQKKKYIGTLGQGNLATEFVIDIEHRKHLFNLCDPKLKHSWLLKEVDQVFIWFVHIIIPISNVQRHLRQCKKNIGCFFAAPNPNLKVFQAIWVCFIF